MTFLEGFEQWLEAFGKAADKDKTMANQFYCYVVVNGDRKYFSDSQLRLANETAQREADKTGNPVKRQNCADNGHSLFYPQRSVASERSTDKRIQR
jgi:hypothetical protein